MSRRIIVAVRLAKDGRPSGFGCFSNLKLFCQGKPALYYRITKDNNWKAGRPFFDKDLFIIRFEQNKMNDLSSDISLESLAGAMPQEVAGLIEKAENQARVLKQIQKVYQVPEEKIYPA